jgi:mannose-6-phosphate isomerase-like protein (cupin superfamily)
MQRVAPCVVPLSSVPATPKEAAPTKVRIARLVTRERCGSNLVVGVSWLDAGDKTNVWSTQETDDGGADHYYGAVEEAYFVLTGRLRLTWDDGSAEFGANDAVYLATGWKYELENIGDEPAQLVYCFAPSPEETERPWRDSLQRPT